MRETKEGVVLPIKVSPKAAKNALVGWENEELKVRLNALPAKGEANSELIAFLAKVFQTSKAQLMLISGEKSRHKKVLIRGMAKKVLEEKIASLLDEDG